MRKITIYMSEKNYVSIGKRHIFINFTRHNLDLLNELHPGSIQKIHVFITNHASINESLRFLVQRFGMTDKAKVIIHLPKPVKELKDFLLQFLGEEGYQFYPLRRGISFSQPGYYGGNTRDAYGPASLVIYPSSNRLSVKIVGEAMLPSIKFPNYPYNSASEEEQGIFENVEMRIDPMKFKDQLVAAFRKSCPEGILKSFKTDDEIMEYIMQQGEWAIKEEEK